VPKLEQIKFAVCFAFTLVFAIPTAHAGGDPFESFNRAMHEFNANYYGSASQGANQFFSDYMPDPVRKGITNFFSNLGEPVTAFSSLAQGDFENAEIATKRFLYNLTLGFGGLVDRASELGVHSKPIGVGEVFCSYGVPEGPYLVLPFYGPATVADFFGSTLPIMAGYVTMGEAFWIYRASSRVASYMDDPNAPPAETGADPQAAADAAKAASEEAYRRAREQYLAAREAACRKAAEPAAEQPPAVQTQEIPHGSLQRGHAYTELAQVPR